MKIGKFFFWLWSSEYRREIAFSLLIKMLLLTLVWYTGFREPVKDQLATPQVKHRIFDEVVAGGAGS